MGFWKLQACKGTKSLLILWWATSCLFKQKDFLGLTELPCNVLHLWFVWCIFLGSSSVLGPNEM